jgi:uncharacterized iron-regulated protein
VARGAPAWDAPEMSTLLPRLLAFVVLAVALAGCVQRRAQAPPGAPVADAPPRQPTRSVAAAPTSVLRDGASGEPADWAAVQRVVSASDVVAFGEFHDDVEGARFEERLWRLVTAAPDARPGTLAMEFFERDVQPALDAYLAGSLDETEFAKRARQGPGYPKAHRPLVEHAKAAGRPVVAANAPRSLVTAYRKQEAPYAEWKAGLATEQQAALPRGTSVIEDAYREKFMALMGAERGARIFKAQSLWDDAMAEAVADRRAAHPSERVLLVVGAFHVQGRLGTLTKLAQRRPGDRVGLIVMAHADDAALSLPADLRGAADLVLVVPQPRAQPAPPSAPAAPPTGARPAQPPVPQPKT